MGEASHVSMKCKQGIGLGGEMRIYGDWTGLRPVF